MRGQRLSMGDYVKLTGTKDGVTASGCRSCWLFSLRALAIDGIGIAMLPAWFVESEVGRGTLRIVLPEWQTEPVIVRALQRREDRGTARIRALVEHLCAPYERMAR